MRYKLQGHYKSSDLSSILLMQFGKNMNLAHIKAMSMMICALCKVQRVAYTKLSAAFETDAEAYSSLRRIQRLIASSVIDTDLIAKLILKLIPVEGPYNLAMDRTNWKFSDTNINILTLGIIYEGMAFPVVFKLMDKRVISPARRSKTRTGSLSCRYLSRTAMRRKPLRCIASGGRSRPASRG